MKKIKAVIFDLDGTLGNTLPLCVEAFKKSVEPLVGKHISEEEIVATFGPSEEGTIQALVPEYYDKGLSDYLHFYETLHEMCPAPFEGITDLLNDLKGKQVRIAMVTGKGMKSTKITLQKFGITQYFETIETGHPQGARKPEGIKAVLDYFQGIDKNEVIYVGDAPSDISASKEAGVSIVAAAWADTAQPAILAELNPDKLFYNVDEFSNWLISNS